MASKHIGSSLFITDASGIASQQLQYLPFGELFVEQQTLTNYSTPYKFSGKEKDEETSYSYFGARYYMSDVSVWLSVDPLADDYPKQSPFSYCGYRPINVIDPDGRGEDDWIKTEKGKVVYDSRVDAVQYYGDKATVIPDGSTSKYNGNQITLNRNGSFTYNGNEGWAIDQASGLPAYMPRPLASGRCDYSPINVETILLGGVAVVKGIFYLAKGASGNIKPNEDAQDVADYLSNSNGVPKPGYKGGKIFKNDGHTGGEVLPSKGSDGTQISYKEYDVRPFQKGVSRGTERLVIGSDGKVYYTINHYLKFIKIK